MKTKLMIIVLSTIVLLSGCYEDNSSQLHKSDMYKIYTLNTEMFLLNTSTGHTWELAFTEDKSAYWTPIYFSATSKIADPAKALKLDKKTEELLRKAGFPEDKNNLTTSPPNTNK